MPHRTPPARQITYTKEDLRDVDRLDRVFLQIESSLSKLSAPPPPPDLAALAAQLAPYIRTDLQATGNYPLNLESLIPAVASGIFLEDTHANRVALYNVNNYDVGTAFYETDRTVIYLVALSGAAKIWQYAAGIHDATLASIPTDLGTGDSGFLFEVTDYDHVLQWTGSAWTWGPGELGSGYYQLFEDTPNTVGANAWQLCDGTAVDRLNADGSTTNVTTPNLATAAYLKGGTASAAVAAASGTVANTTATNQATTATNQSATTGVTVDAHATDENTDVGTGNFAFPETTDADHVVNDAGHNHTQDSHNHTQDAHNHAPGTLELRNKQVTMYYRR